ncbi:MAG: hypothetical protein A3F41_06525 [Coxiella sp. RIFCSPHIGHO2_12_FULL_44_14]|nr:MAG: hypothetical protein A3F41_06525 [Coxiella sp. RIFCSPHIGHO2_12_FULL_44_14]
MSIYRCGWFRIAVVFLGLWGNVAVAGPEPQNDSSTNASKQQTCVYRYLTCLDDCDYRQNVEEVTPCKSNCKRQYSCRPKKVVLPPGEDSPPG